jgi:hypothetical protein
MQWILGLRPVSHLQFPETVVSMGGPMKRAAVWVFYAFGALAVGYLALYAYVVFTGRSFHPGEPIHIFRKPGTDLG